MNVLTLPAFNVGAYHTMATTFTNELYGWGQNVYYQLGTGETANKQEPTLIEGVDEKVAHLACGMYHTMAVTVSGKLYTWGGGYNTVGYPVCGHGSSTGTTTPTVVAALEDQFVVQAVSGYYHSMALTREGRIYTWGCNSWNQVRASDSFCL